MNVHSGLICLDFDGYSTNRELLQEKERLTKDKYIYTVFISPSGKGLKALVKIPQAPDKHTSFFNSLGKHFNSPQFDTTSKNLSRVCYESYDPLIYINETSSVWDKEEEQEYNEILKNVDKPTIPVTDENKIVEILVKWWEKKYPMMEGQRNHHAYVLAAAFNDYGINQNLAEYILGQYESRNFDKHEIKKNNTICLFTTTELWNKILRG